jgi:hypothetical protein
MTESEIAKVVIAAVSDCLAASGRPTPQLELDTPIITGIKGFDSLCGIETTIALEGRLGIALGNNIFVKEVNGRPRARTLREVVKAIASLVKEHSHAGTQ